MMLDKLEKIFLHTKKAREGFYNAIDIFLDMAERNEPLPKIAESAAPHLRPVFQQYTGFIGRKKLQAGGLIAKQWFLDRLDEDTIESVLKQSRAHLSQDVSQKSNDIMGMAQKFLDGLDPNNIQHAMETHKNAITTDMIEDTIAILSAVRSILPNKLSVFLEDIVPEIDDFENIIRKEADVFVNTDSGEQVKKVFDQAKQHTTKNHDELVEKGQSGLMDLIEEIEPAVIKRVLDYVLDSMTQSELNNLMVTFCAFADEVLEAFEDQSIPLREREYEHGAAYKEAISEFLQYVEDALDAEGILPDQIDTAKLNQKVRGFVGGKPPRL